MSQLQFYSCVWTQISDPSSKLFLPVSSPTQLMEIIFFQYSDRKKKNNPLFLDSILLYPHIKFISKFYWLSLPSKYWQIPKSEKFPDALTVEGLGSIPGLRELRSHKPHSTAKKKTTTNFQILTTFHSFYCYLHYHILSQLLPYPLTGSPAIALCLPPTILKVVCRLCAMLC